MFIDIRMPFTPFHFGPALALSFWDYKKKRVDLFTCLIASVIVDIRAIYIWFFGNGNFHDGPFHTFLISALLGGFIGLFAHLVKTPISKFTKFIDWEQNTSLFSKIIVGMSMAMFHVLLDSPLYTDIFPFRPFSQMNPLYGIVQSRLIYLFCTLGFVLGFFEYLGYRWWKSKKYYSEENDFYE